MKPIHVKACLGVVGCAALGGAVVAAQHDHLIFGCLSASLAVFCGLGIEAIRQWEDENENKGGARC